MEINGGVISQHSIHPDVWDDLIYNNKDSINLEWFFHLKGCENKEHDECYFDEEPTYIVGFKLDKETDLYDINDESEFNLIFNTHYGEIQIIKSKYMIRNRQICSPCFPNQIDLNSKGMHTGYCLPPEYLVKEMQPLIEEI